MSSFSNYNYPYIRNDIYPQVQQMPANIVAQQIPQAHVMPYSYDTQNSAYFTNPITQSYINPKIAANYTFLGTVQTPYGENIYTYMLQNGQRVAILPREGTTILKTFVDSGSMNENDRIRGISHFIEHNLFNGSDKLAPGQLFKDVVKMGASTNASTDYAQTDYYISSGIMNKNDFKKALEMHADMILHPKFYTDMLEKEKAPVTSEISMITDDAVTNAANEVVRNLFQINSNSQNLVAGSIETVNGLNRNDVVDYWQKHYTPDSLFTVIVGEVNPQEAIEAVAHNFNQPARVRTNDVYKEQLTPITTSKRIDMKSSNQNSTNVLMGFAAPPASDLKNSLALEALGVMLDGTSSSRLTKKLQPLNSYSSISTQKVGLKRNDPQALFAHINCPANQEQKVIDAFYETVFEINQNPPSEFEMQYVKNTLTKLCAVNFENADFICETIGDGMVDGNLNQLPQMIEIINNLTPQDLVNAANSYLDLNRVSMAVVHPANVTDEQISNNYKQSKLITNKPTQKAISFGSRKIDTNDVQECILKNNTHLALNNSDKTDVCYLNWRLSAISAVPKNPAVPYVLTELLNAGSKNVSKEQMKNQTNLNGIDYDFDSSGFQITVQADCMSKDLSKTLDILNEVMYSPNFSQKEFEAAKTKIKEYFISLQKDGSNNMLTQLYPGYFASTSEILSGLDKMTIADVQKHHRDMLTKASSNFVVSAPFSKQPELKNVVMSKTAQSPVRYKDYKPTFSNIYKPNQKSTVVVDTAELNQAQIYKTYSFKMSGNIKDEVKFELLNEILGGSPASRLFQNLREQDKLAYRVSSQVQSFEDTGVLTMFIMTTTDNKEQNDIKYDNLKKSLDGFDREVNNILNYPVSEEELQSAKMQLKQRIAKQTELAGSKTALLSMNMTLPYGIKRIDEYVKVIDEITVQDIQTAAGHVFGNKPTVSILASADTIENQKEYINSLGEVVLKA